MRLLKQDNRIPMSQALEFGRDICEGLFFVHTRGVIYTDLKPSNVLFDESGALKLSDFGMAILLEDLVMDGAPIPRRGTPYYMAPELFLEDGTHSFASDLWSLGGLWGSGCSLFHMVAVGPSAVGPAAMNRAVR